MSDEDSRPVASVSDLSEFEKGQIVGAYLGGLSIEDVSRMCNVTSQTVSEILNVHKLYLSIRPGLKRRAGSVNTRKRQKKAKTQNGGTEETMESKGEAENLAKLKDLTRNKQKSNNDKDCLQVSTEDGQ